MLANVSHVLALTTIRRERRLPAPGKVLVRMGQKVKATDVIAEAKLAPQHILLDVARGLGIEAEDADRLIQRRPGEEIVDGDVIAARKGLARRVVRSPVSGRVVMAGGGQVLLEEEGRPYQLLAGLPGSVIEVIEKRGAVIEMTGSLLQGVWGNGRIDFGVMRVIAEAPTHHLTPDQLDVQMRGSIIFGGRCDQEETLQAAAELSLRGLILFSMPARLTAMAEKIRFPIIVTEGFGDLPMNTAAFKIMSTNADREVVIRAERFDRNTGSRPEIIIPLPAPSRPELPQDAVELARGKQVRIVRPPHAGATGTVSAIRPGLMAFPSGLRTSAARVVLDDGEATLVPLANLEILE